MAATLSYGSLLHGYGKSLCYQLLCCHSCSTSGVAVPTQDTHRCCVIVISPLLALMVDQVSSLRSRGVSAAILSGNAGVDKQYLASEADFLTESCTLIVEDVDDLLNDARFQGWL